MSGLNGELRERLAKLRDGLDDPGERQVVDEAIRLLQPPCARGEESHSYQPVQIARSTDPVGFFCTDCGRGWSVTEAKDGAVETR